MENDKYIDPTKQMRCVDCKWWMSGECHRHAPGPDGFPKVIDFSYNSFCGDFEKRK